MHLDYNIKKRNDSIQQWLRSVKYVGENLSVMINQKSLITAIEQEDLLELLHVLEDALLNYKNVSYSNWKIWMRIL